MLLFIEAVSAPSLFIGRAGEGKLLRFSTQQLNKSTTQQLNNSTTQQINHYLPPLTPPMDKGRT
jgi:hypothetical protein